MHEIPENFLSDVAEVLEVASVAATDSFRSVPMWSSLNAFALVVMIDQRYGRKLALTDLAGATTVADLACLAGVV